LLRLSRGSEDFGIRAVKPGDESDRKAPEMAFGGTDEQNSIRDSANVEQNECLLRRSERVRATIVTLGGGAFGQLVHRPRCLDLLLVEGLPTSQCGGFGHGGRESLACSSCGSVGPQVGHSLEVGGEVNGDRAGAELAVYVPEAVGVGLQLIDERVIDSLGGRQVRDQLS
jgi:hypothetical protein